MSKFLMLLSLMAAHLSSSYSYNINIALRVEGLKQDSGITAISPLSMSPDQTSLVEGLAEDLEESYKNLTHCGFSEARSIKIKKDFDYERSFRS